MSGHVLTLCVLNLEKIYGAAFSNSIQYPSNGISKWEIFCKNLKTYLALLLYTKSYGDREAT